MAHPVCGRSFLPRADKRVSSPKHFCWAPICTTIWYWSSYRRGKLSCRGKLPTRIFVLLQPFPCREIMIIDLFLVALLSLVCLVLTDSSSLVTRLTEECHRSDGERSLEWQTPAVTYPFGSLHDLCVAVVVVLLDEVVRHFRQDLSILLIICQSSCYDSLSSIVRTLPLCCLAAAATTSTWETQQHHLPPISLHSYTTWILVWSTTCMEVMSWNSITVI